MERDHEQHGTVRAHIAREARLRLAWTTQGSPFLLWDRWGLRLEASKAGVRGRRPFIETAVAEVERVEAYVGANWIERGVRLRLRTGAVRRIIRRREWLIVFDSTYDGIDLMCDAAWTVSLATALAAAIGVPCSCDEGL